LGAENRINFNDFLLDRGTISCREVPRGKDALTQLLSDLSRGERPERFAAPVNGPFFSCW
jgi:hypothetical protein